MIDVAANIHKFRELVPAGVEIVAVSKFHPASMILEAYRAGQRNFGESRVQEFLEKQKNLPQDIKWHFIGHLQTNKAKQIIGKTYLIESADSPKIIELLNRESEKAGINTNILLQVHVAAEEAKFGFFPQELMDYLYSEDFRNLKHINVMGVMGMATNTDNEERIRQDFKALYSIFDKIKREFSEEFTEFKYLSMGMSGDWPIAVEEGSNMVRIGSLIFGERV